MIPQPCCPVCYDVFKNEYREGMTYPDKDPEDIKKHYYWHKLEDLASSREAKSSPEPKREDGSL